MDRDVAAFVRGRTRRSAAVPTRVPAAVHPVLRLQRTAGNRAVTSMLAGRPVQRLSWDEMPGFGQIPLDTPSQMVGPAAGVGMGPDGGDMAAADPKTSNLVPVGPEPDLPASPNTPDKDDDDDEDSQ